MYIVHVAKYVFLCRGEYDHILVGKMSIYNVDIECPCIIWIYNVSGEDTIYIVNFYVEENMSIS